MRVSSAAVMKGMKQGTKCRERPDPAARLGVLFDLLMSKRGLRVDGPLHRGDIGRLRDFYGLDIRSLGRNGWVLAGEWVGRVYVDYIAERISEA